ncbi:hypothetical protein [Clavibacter michiganensis]|uniref:hypothetical protein n=1 Tax=Clavibacter michiganensis TaxID=28447 RepID=UPI001F32966E|nr:hypothetical protein [Clavibacter michiganensis]
MSAVAGVLVAAMVTPAIAVTSLAANNTIGLFEDLPDYLQIDNLAQKTELYATQGGQPVKFAEFYAQNRQEVSWDEVSDNAKAAAVDTEDPASTSTAASTCSPRSARSPRTSSAAASSRARAPSPCST